MANPNLTAHLGRTEREAFALFFTATEEAGDVLTEILVGVELDDEWRDYVSNYLRRFKTAAATMTEALERDALAR